MADVVLSPALQVIFDRVASPVLQKLADIWDMKDNLQSLQHALVMVQAILEDAEEQQLTNKAVRLWLLKLKNAAHDADDLLDFVTAKGKDKWTLAISKSIDADKVRKMLLTLEMTVKEGLLKFNFREPGTVDRQSDKRETSSFVMESEIYGRADDKENLVKLLLSSECHQDGYAMCIPIIGIGGIGKTTLAQLAYNDERVIQHFDVRLWTFVSHDFNIKKIMKSIIESVTREDCKFSESDLLQSRLWHLLHNKRYLIVLDDVWTEDQDDWDKLRPLFRRGVDGCKIIITSRNKKIPFMMDSLNSAYYLKGLMEDDCWALFKQRAFGREEEEKYPDLCLIGKQIAKTCGGVPLAAKSLGSVMRFKREERQWLFMQNSELWEVDGCKQRILPALMLSYLHLAAHLRQCFAFCSIFPKNYEFKKHKLVLLWMAEGLILEEGSKRPEDIGDEYFSDLLWMSFFQEVELRDGGSTIGYKMNDVIHDLARYVSGNESVMLEQGLPPSNPAQIRRSSIIYKYREVTIPEALFEAEHLRTVLLIGEYGLLKDSSKMLLNCIYLRVLDLNNCDVHFLPSSIGGLICLRYLDLSYTPISKLPATTRNLCSLQTLNLSGCHNLRVLRDFEAMTSLRHLNITGCDSLWYISPCIKMLLQLQTLPLYFVRKNPGNLGALENLNLYGELNITHLENIRNATGAQSSGLKMKENIESLGLYWGDFGDVHDRNKSILKKPAKSSAKWYCSEVGMRWHEPDAEEAVEILDGLKPHKNLKKLVIHGYPGIRFPDWKLPNLIAVDLSNCKNCEYLPALGNLLLLKTLSLHGMESVTRIGFEFHRDSTDICFSSLEELSLSDFPKLETWSSANNENAFPSLRKLTIRRCPKLTQIPFCLSLQHLELRDCNPSSIFIGGLTLLTVLVIEKLPQLRTLPQGLSASASLSSLEVLSCPKLCSLPLEMGNLTALKSLTIRWCDELSSLPQSLQNLKALESLEISDCHSIISMPDGAIGGLSSLQTLSIENCSSLTSLSSSLEQLAFLERFTIMYCPNLGSFPEGVQHLSTLRTLSILSCPWFDSLPEELQMVKTLQCLEISSCPNFTALPEWVEKLASLRSLTIFDCPNLKLLPQSLELLTKLQHLSIQECPELEERCRQGSGEDWLKIAHVPHKHIGSPEMRQSSSEASTSGSSSVETSV
ncbi:putative P-loop containing nucleoside triphosphate hydrolase, leucine-rich repeat domain, L [Rosa chinensis]|uniref:Putative P-loop containing nucleoside triphosphate hydrolase, leucine-rich repeat domain, L n=1 Tax=Rosa chinensis TaxID=74649 RepID=A0A2P6SFK7_ROSCH|nr:disease resistance protein RGA2 [Rosa chinensis]PRQ57458.1 putative P-loop containing nucleoside triphosphate hydrolase, leucine-rich repeat domain, L [Rosa chinensis]